MNLVVVLRWGQLSFSASWFRARTARLNRLQQWPKDRSALWTWPFETLFHCPRFVHIPTPYISSALWLKRRYSKAVLRMPHRAPELWEIKWAYDIFSWDVWGYGHSHFCSTSVCGNQWWQWWGANLLKWEFLSCRHPRRVLNLFFLS